MPTLSKIVTKSDPLPRPSPALGTYVAIILAGLVPICLGVATDPAPGNMPWGHVSIMIIAGLRYAWLMASATRHLYEMILWLFIYVFLGMAPFVQQALEVTPGTTEGLRPEFFGPAVGVVIAGSLAAILGSYLAGNAKVTLGESGRVVTPGRANLLAFAALGIGAYYGSQVGFSTFLDSRTELSLARQAVWSQSAVSALVTAVLNMGLLTAFVAQMHLRYQSKLAEMPRPIFLPLVTGLALLFFVNPISSPRYVFGTVLLGMLATLGAYKTIKRYRFFAGLSLVGLLTIFPLADSFRFSASASIKSQSPLESLTSGDFDAFAQIVNTMEYVSEKGITWGQQLVGVALVWVPRSWWPNKPVDTGVLLAEFKGYGFTNLSSPLWAEFFINGGWAFLIGGMLLLGYYFRFADKNGEQALTLAAVPPVSICIMPFYLLIVLRGSLLNAASYLIVIVLCSWFVTRKRD